MGGLMAATPGRLWSQSGRFAPGPAACVMAASALLLVSTTVPAAAFAATTTLDGSSGTAATRVATVTGGTQTYVVTAGGAVIDVSRDGYAITDPPPPPPPPVIVAGTGEDGRDYEYNAASAGTVQWPFPDGSPISSGFGARQVANCGFCSTYHQGLDFVPGSGTPIHAIAAGSVTKVSGPGGAYGYHVEVEHVVDGQKIVSTYSHMQAGSVTVKAGDTLAVGDVVGKVGSTGNSTGAHLHFEVHVGGVPVDPMAWMLAHAS